MPKYGIMSSFFTLVPMLWKLSNGSNHFSEPKVDSFKREKLNAEQIAFWLRVSIYGSYAIYHQQRLDSSNREKMNAEQIAFCLIVSMYGS